LFSNAKTNI